MADGRGPLTTVGKTFADGKYADAQCPVCGEVVAYASLQKRWDGERVCRACLDPRHPAEVRKNFKDAIALRHAKPENISFNPVVGYGIAAATVDAAGTFTVVIS